MIEDSGGNVFADLDLPDAEGLLAREQLVSTIDDAIQAAGLARGAAAMRMGTSLSELSAILDGTCETASTQKLLELLVRLGLEIDVAVHTGPAQPTRTSGKINVAIAR